MSDKCTHETAIVEGEYFGFSLLQCTWGCGEHLVQVNMDNHTVKTYTAAELTELTARLAAVEAERDEWKKRAEHAAKIKADDKNGFDWAVLDRIGELERAIENTLIFKPFLESQESTALNKIVKQLVMVLQESK